MVGLTMSAGMELGKGRARPGRGEGEARERAKETSG